MNMLRRTVSAIALGLLGFNLITCSKSWAQSALSEPNPPAVFMVIENGGTVTQQEELAEHINFLLGEMTDWRKKKASRNVQINIILSANPTEISWSGTPEQLFMQGHQVLELIAFQATCSDLELAWREAQLAIRADRPSSYQLIGIGPMIHAGFPCDQGDNIIRLPQPVPDNLVLGQLALEAERLVLLGVHADQDEIYLDHFESIGVMDRVQAGEVRFGFLDMARARAAQGDVLGEF